ncbi:MAG: ATP-dependent 6-phosphofructokinase [Myxococcales bacterium]|nr:ATP-dependent 6-phosphofructokinase [Myxococcales bacterium]
MTTRPTLGILTSGGDSPGMNAAIRAIFRSAKKRNPDRELIFFRDGFRGLAGRLDSSTDRDVDRSAVRDIIHRGGTFIGTGRVPQLKLPPESAPDFAARKVAQEAFLKVAAVNLYQLGVHDLVVIGGDGSYRGALTIAAYFRGMFPDRPFRVIGLPGTIDNDVWGSDLSIGYDTALNNIVDAVRKIRDTVDSHQRGIILEVMGNTSGWLALQSAIAGGASVVAIPEVPETWDHDRIIARLRAGVRNQYRYFIILVAEGVLKRAGADWSQRLAQRIESDPDIHDTDGMPMDVRVNSVGHVARGGRPSAVDNTIATQLGAASVELALTGGLDGVPLPGDIALGTAGSAVVAHPLEAVCAHSPRLVTTDCSLFSLSEQMMLAPDQPF